MGRDSVERLVEGSGGSGNRLLVIEGSGMI